MTNINTTQSLLSFLINNHKSFPDNPIPYFPSSPFCICHQVHLSRVIGIYLTDRMMFIVVECLSGWINFVYFIFPQKGHEIFVKRLQIIKVFVLLGVSFASVDGFG